MNQRSTVLIKREIHFKRNCEVENRSRCRTGPGVISYRNRKFNDCIIKSKLRNCAQKAPAEMR